METRPAMRETRCCEDRRRMRGNWEERGDDGLLDKGLRADEVPVTSGDVGLGEAGREEKGRGDDGRD